MLAVDCRPELDTWTFSVNRDAVATSLGDGRVTLANFSTESTCTLDSDGLEVWFCLQQGCSVTDIIHRLCGASQMPAQDLRIAGKVTAVLLDLLGHEMIYPSCHWRHVGRDDKAPAEIMEGNHGNQ